MSNMYSTAVMCILCFQWLFIGIGRLGIGRIGRFQYSNNFQHILVFIYTYIYFYVHWKLPIKIYWHWKAWNWKNWKIPIASNLPMHIADLADHAKYLRQSFGPFHLIQFKGVVNAEFFHKIWRNHYYPFICEGT